MVNETTILVICFVITFGFLGYKLSGFVKKILDNYRNKIEDIINKSEQLKLEAIATLDEANKREKYINDEIEKMHKKAEEKMEEIEDNFDKKLKDMTEKTISNNKKKMLLEQENSIENFKNQIKEKIEKVIIEYVKTLTSENKNVAVENAVNKIDFKKLVNNN